MFVLFAVLAASSVASPKDKQQIRALYARLKNAMITKNMAAIEKMEAPGFSDTEMGKTFTAAEANAQMKQHFASIKKMKHMSMQITNLNVKNKNAVAKTKYAMEAIFSGPDKKNHNLKITGTTEDNLVKTAKGWLFQSEKDTGTKALVDGKPMQGT